MARAPLKIKRRTDLTLDDVMRLLMVARDGNNEDAVVPGMTGAQLQLLGCQLFEILDGVDPYEVFGLPKRTGRPKDRGDFYAAHAYWWHRAQFPTDATGAMAAAKKESDKDDATLQRIMRRQRDQHLKMIDSFVDTRAIREHLKRQQKKTTAT